MSIMGSYCKAYPVSRFEAFPGWREAPLPPVPEDEPQEDGEVLDERYLFLQETFVVTDGVFLDERVVFDDVTPEWIEFCRTTLEFAVPEVEPMPAFGDPATHDGGADERPGTEAVER
jgi:hypothetical protein